MGKKSAMPTGMSAFIPAHTVYSSVTTKVKTRMHTIKISQ